MAGRQRIDRVRRQYNQWVANQTLEDYALRFTAKSARRWSAARVANTALGAISFLALEAIGGTITLNYGVTNATVAILVVSVIIFLCGLPIAYHAAKCGIDIDLLTRGAGFGYIGSTITSLIYASFTFIFFALEAVILAAALEMCFGIPRPIGYLISAVVIIPLVTYGITLISRFQLWTQPIWIILHVLPFVAIAYANPQSFTEWRKFAGEHGDPGGHLDLLLFGTAASVVFSLVAQIGEQVDFLRFLPRDRRTSRTSWWIALLSAGPGWIIFGALKLLLGSFLAYFALSHGVSSEHAAEPAHMYLEAFRYVLSQPDLVLALTGTFVILSQIKINVTNAYAGSIAWSNFFSRLTHSHPGRVVWLVFNVMVALLLMEIGVYKALEQTLALYSNVAIAWVGALVADLVINKPLGLRPQHIEFKRAHLYDINPVGVGAMTIATIVSISAFYGLFGPTAKALSAFVALAAAFVTAPLIAWATDGKYYIARKPKRSWQNLEAIQCCICEHSFEPEDMASCPAYAGPICSLCCSLDARCHDLCKPHARIGAQVSETLGKILPEPIYARINSQFGHYLGVFAVSAGLVGLTLGLIYLQTSATIAVDNLLLSDVLWKVFFALTIIIGVVAWLVRAGATEPPRGGSGNAAANYTADPGNRRAQAHRRRAAARQGSRGIGQPRQEPLRGGPESRTALAAERHLGLCAVAGAGFRPCHQAARPGARGPPQRRPSVGADRRHSGYFQDRGRPALSVARRGAAERISRAARRHVSRPGRRQGHRLRFQAAFGAARRRVCR